MLGGGCLCGKCTVTHDGETNFKALCHCQDCRKISGSTYSTNLFVPTSALQLVSGTPKQYSKRTDAGNSITSYFCGDCGVTLWRQSSGYPVRLGVKIVKEGVLEEMSGAEPTVEFYTWQRVGWVPKVAGAAES